MPLTYCACVGQEEEITHSIFVAGRKEKVVVLNHELFFPHEQRKNTKSLYVSVKAYLLVAFVGLLWVILRCTGNLQPFWRNAPCQLYRPLFLQCLNFYFGSFVQVHAGSKCLCKWWAAVLAGMELWLCVQAHSAMKAGFRSRWKSSPLQCIAGCFGWIFRSDTTEQQSCFVMIEKLISTLWRWWVWRAMIGVCFLPHAVITGFCLWKHKPKTYWDFGVVMKRELCDALE